MTQTPKEQVEQDIEMSWVERWSNVLKSPDPADVLVWDIRKIVVAAVIIVPVIFGLAILLLGGLSYVSAATGHEEDHAEMTELIHERTAEAEVAEGKYHQIYRDQLASYFDISSEQIDQDIAMMDQEIYRALYRDDTASSEDDNNGVLDIERPDTMSDDTQVLSDWDDWYVLSDAASATRYMAIVELIELSDEESAEYDEIFAESTSQEVVSFSVGDRVVEPSAVEQIKDNAEGQRWYLAVEFGTQAPGELRWSQAQWLTEVEQYALLAEATTDEELNGDDEDVTE